MITQEELKEILDYDLETGIFTWKPNSNKNKSWNTKHAGKPAGSKVSGYIRITINKSKYYAHRLAYLYVLGAIPAKIDHRDLDGTNNAWDNIRKASSSDNGANRNKRSDNTSGYKNISWHSLTNKWHVQVMKEGKSISGGYITELKDAVDVANKLRLKVFGEFATQETYRD
ncbi:homing endonuclease [Salmonella phage falkor]|uniref:Homing endonuclease n=2 Tax=Caudoviricetes TaxID=2731619 RepID=A0A6G8RKH8_9CAUD|nr:homing endonuclease [Salmonella phage falkor]